jgi:hypothetical protein
MIGTVRLMGKGSLAERVGRPKSVSDLTTTEAAAGDMPTVPNPLRATAREAATVVPPHQARVKATRVAVDATSRRLLSPRGAHLPSCPSPRPVPTVGGVPRLPIRSRLRQWIPAPPHSESTGRRQLLQWHPRRWRPSHGGPHLPRPHPLPERAKQRRPLLHRRGAARRE